MIKTFIKYKLIEIAINTFFSELSNNFIPNTNIFKVGNEYRVLQGTYMINNNKFYSVIFNNCIITGVYVDLVDQYDFIEFDCDSEWEQDETGTYIDITDDTHKGVLHISRLTMVIPK